MQSTFSDPPHLLVYARLSIMAAAFQRVGLRVKEPTRRGFGRAAIGRSLQYSPHGGANLSFHPTELDAQFAFLWTT